MDQVLHPAEFLSACKTRVLLDVRAPAEYAQGHIPGAISFPLFSDNERAEVGTLYKQTGNEAALLHGLKIVGPKMEVFVREALRLAPQRRLAVHCWRGGQRSRSMAWLFRQAGFDVVTLNEGYKNYRKHVLEMLSQAQIDMIIVGGKTGTGKTKILRALKEMGEQIVDIEALAHHKGSSFGSIGELPQPTVEQFENDLWNAMSLLDFKRRVWIENESRSIGRVFIPEGFWNEMKAAPLFNIEVPFECRIQNLVDDYTGVSETELVAAFLRISKKLGGQHLKTALDALQAADYAAAAAIALRYYDKTYQYGLETNASPFIVQLQFNHSNPLSIASECRSMADASPRTSGKSVPLEAD